MTVARVHVAQPLAPVVGVVASASVTVRIAPARQIDARAIVIVGDGSVTCNLAPRIHAASASAARSIRSVASMSVAGSEVLAPAVRHVAFASVAVGVRPAAHVRARAVLARGAGLVVNSLSAATGAARHIRRVAVVRVAIAELRAPVVLVVLLASVAVAVCPPGDVGARRLLLDAFPPSASTASLARSMPGVLVAIAEDRTPIVRFVLRAIVTIAVSPASYVGASQVPTKAARPRATSRDELVPVSESLLAWGVALRRSPDCGCVASTYDAVHRCELSAANARGIPNLAAELLQWMRIIHTATECGFTAKTTILAGAFLE